MNYSDRQVFILEVRTLIISKKDQMNQIKPKRTKPRHNEEALVYRFNIKQVNCNFHATYTVMPERCHADEVKDLFVQGKDKVREGSSTE